MQHGRSWYASRRQFERTSYGQTGRIRLIRQRRQRNQVTGSCPLLAKPTPRQYVACFTRFRKPARAGRAGNGRFGLPRLCSVRGSAARGHGAFRVFAHICPWGHNGPIVKLSIGGHHVKFWQMYRYPTGVKMLQLLEYPKIGPR
jgi:hypothetical protein